MNDPFANRNSEEALRELDGTRWLIGIPLVIGLVLMVWGCSIVIQQSEWERRFESEPTYETGLIVKVASGECASQPKPDGDHFCGYAPAEWYVPIYEPEGCGGDTGQCYIPATLKLTRDYLEEASSGTLVPFGGIGLIPLLLIFIAMRRVSKARKHLQG